MERTLHGAQRFAAARGLRREPRERGLGGRAAKHRDHARRVARDGHGRARDGLEARERLVVDLRARRRRGARRGGEADGAQQGQHKPANKRRGTANRPRSHSHRTATADTQTPARRGRFPGHGAQNRSSDTLAHWRRRLRVCRQLMVTRKRTTSVSSTPVLVPSVALTSASSVDPVRPQASASALFAVQPVVAPARSYSMSAPPA